MANAVGVDWSKGSSVLHVPNPEQRSDESDAPPTPLTAHKFWGAVLARGHVQLHPPPSRTGQRIDFLQQLGEMMSGRAADFLGWRRGPGRVAVKKAS